MTQKVAQIENEYGRPIDEVLKDFARDCSFSFTCKVLECTRYQLRHYQHLFKPFCQPSNKGRKCAWVAQTNKGRAKVYDNGLTLAQMSEASGLHYNTLHYRLNVLKWPPEKALNEPPAPRGDTSRFGRAGIEHRTKLRKLWS